MTGNLLATFSSNAIYVINKTPTRFGGGADAIVTLSGIGVLNSSPLLFTDQTGTTWLYFVTTSGILYAAGGFLAVQNPYVDPNGGNVISFWKSFETNIESSATPVIDGNSSIYVSFFSFFPDIIAGVYRYPTPPANPTPRANDGGFGGNYYTVVNSGGALRGVYTSPVISSQNKLSFVAYEPTTGTNYIYTISSA
jgi:hypothetical protein